MSAACTHTHICKNTYSIILYTLKGKLFIIISILEKIALKMHSWLKIRTPQHIHTAHIILSNVCMSFIFHINIEFNSVWTVVVFFKCPSTNSMYHSCYIYHLSSNSGCNSTTPWYFSLLHFTNESLIFNWQWMTPFFATHD